MIPTTLTEECKTKYAAWTTQSTPMTLHKALGVIWAHTFKPNGLQETTIEDVKAAIGCISVQYPVLKDLDRIFIYPLAGQIGLLTERLQTQLQPHGRGYGLAPAEVIALLDSECDQESRDTVKHLLIALHAIRDEEEIKVDKSVYEEMHVRGVISSSALMYIQHYMDPISEISEATGELDSCSVCFLSKEMYKLKSCTHCLCRDCLQIIYRSNPACPLFRAKIPPKDIQHPYAFTPLGITEY